MAIFSASFGLVLNVLPQVSGFWSILLCSSMVGLSTGTSMVVMSVLVGDYAGKISDVPVLFGLMTFSTGLTGLTRPYLIGKSLLS